MEWKEIVWLFKSFTGDHADLEPDFSFCFPFWKVRVDTEQIPFASFCHCFAIALPSFHRSPRVDDIPGRMRVDRLRCDVKIDLPCSCLQECNKKCFLCYILNICVKYHRVLFPASRLHFGCHCMLWILCVFCVSGIAASNVFK